GLRPGTRGRFHGFTSCCPAVPAHCRQVVLSTLFVGVNVAGAVDSRTMTGATSVVSATAVPSGPLQACRAPDRHTAQPGDPERMQPMLDERTLPRKRRAPASTPLVPLAALALLTTAPAGVWSAALPWADARQLVLVTTPGWVSRQGARRVGRGPAPGGDGRQGTLRGSARRGRGGEEAGSAVPVGRARAGRAGGVGPHPPQPGPQKREGDGRSPAGVFRIGTAFGYAD